MKKILLGSAAIVLGLGFAAPAKAEGVKLDLGGHFKGYGVWSDQDETTGSETHDFGFLRETEVHFTGETTLDNGLTVGAHIEAETDGGTDATTDGFEVEESYAYFSGAWGRVNFGAEDGAAYLLQVAAPSADSNLDGIRTYVNPLNYTTSGNAGLIALGDAEVLDYDNAIFGSEDANKLTYLTPVFSGFQFGASYSPDITDDNRDLEGLSSDDDTDELGDTWEVGGRYEGQLGEVGLAFGAGYLKANLEEDSGAGDDDQEIWNAGVDLNWGAFGLGAAYMENNEATDNDGDQTNWVVGADYTTGPFKLGVSYLNRDQDATATTDVQFDRYTGGVVYTYGPGMTFRGSISFVDINTDVAASEDTQATSVLIGTQIDF